MIYFETNKKDLGLDFIDINVPADNAQLEDYYATRRKIFCDEQQIFTTTDYDENDYCSIPIVALNHYCGSPDEVVGVVRIYEETEREWFGGRLGVVEEYRSFSKFVCPNLFNQNEVSPLYKSSVAAGLIYRAVSLANYIGCDKFSAHVQTQNVKLFKRLHWNVVKEIEVYGITHFLMEADLKFYPKTPIFAASIVNNDLKALLKAA